MQEAPLRPHDTPLVTLTTDFGLQDGYVGSMKGVILSVEPRLCIVDITHQLPPHRILPAAFLLRETCPRFPRDTIHVAVIDPGVGGTRRPVLLKLGGHWYVGPDNGIFGLLLQDQALAGAWLLENRAFFLPSVSPTFHGRDLFAPAAAHLARGVPPEAFGPEISDPEPFRLPPLRETAHDLQGEVIWIDHFGNCVTNLPASLVAGWAQGKQAQVWVGDRVLGPIRKTYASVQIGEPLALVGSVGTLEVACNLQRADQALSLKEGDPVVLKKP